MNRPIRSAMTVFGMIALEPFARPFVDLVKALRHRREIKHLAELDDWMLRDIGLTRSDVSSALAEPLLRNPSWVLVRSVERQSRSERVYHPAKPAQPIISFVTPAKRCA
jgi:uncharacterized protein YjiS (DUF1127 family)